MSLKTIFSLTLIVFFLLCGVLIVQSGLFCPCCDNQPCILLQSTAETAAESKPPAKEPAKLQPTPKADYSAVGGPSETVQLGSLDPNTGFKFQLELTSRGAAIKKATMSGFDDRDPENPQPLVLLSPIETGNDEILSMANGSLEFVDEKFRFPLNRLNWKTLDVEKGENGQQSVTFEALLKNKDTGEQIARITKTYRVMPDSYDFECSVDVENLSDSSKQIRLEMTGPAGIEREDNRTDSRKLMACFRNHEGQFVSTKIDMRKFDGRKSFDEDILDVGQKNTEFLWAGITNKYFAALVIPRPQGDKDFCDWINGRLNLKGDQQIIKRPKRGIFSVLSRLFGNQSEEEKIKTGKEALFFNPDGQSGSEDENIALGLNSDAVGLGTKGADDSKVEYGYRIYIGPKDKSLFDKNDLYKKLGFVQTIDFMACCCPTAVIHPLGFGILAMMKWLHSFIPNYGVVIIIFVFLVRLMLHPLTKKSQVSMSKYSKFNSLPEVQEIRKKYGKDIMEMNRRIGELQKKHGVSHSAAITGMLPMMVQMPIWIALYGAIYASIDLRGAEFLPVWITDLSAPDALFRFKAFTVPLFGKLDSFNLLPILMGVGFYLQQKLNPSQTAASPDPQTAQQQKMMMVMMTALFPLMLYKAPSGLNLYIMSSVFAGAIEQYFIRKHIREKEEAESKGLVPVTSKTGGKVKKKKPKPFFKT